jgi:hypothetical protein
MFIIHSNISTNSLSLWPRPLQAQCHLLVLLVENLYVNHLNEHGYQIRRRSVHGTKAGA